MVSAARHGQREATYTQSYYSPMSRAQCRIALHSNTAHIHYRGIYNAIQRYTTLYNAIQRYTSLYNNIIHYTTPHYTTLYGIWYTVMHCAIQLYSYTAIQQYTHTHTAQHSTTVQCHTAIHPRSRHRAVHSRHCALCAETQLAHPGPVHPHTHTPTGLARPRLCHPQCLCGRAHCTSHPCTTPTHSAATPTDPRRLRCWPWQRARR